MAGRDRWRVRPRLHLLKDVGDDGGADWDIGNPSENAEQRVRGLGVPGVDPWEDRGSATCADQCMCGCRCIDFLKGTDTNHIHTQHT